MTTPRDLLIVALDEAPPSMGQGDLSLALAGAEAIDLLGTGSARLDGERILPGAGPGTLDRLLAEAAASLEDPAEGETVEDWLWRRGRGLSAAYLTALEQEGLVTRQHRRWAPFRAGRTVLADTAERRGAAERWAAGEPVLAALAAALGMRTPAGEVAAPAGDTVTAVLAAVNDAVMELEAVRQRRAIEEAAFDNVWRGTG
ncbi:hypothetical protein GCM10018793_17770 [Streptomyces sulfonofaciens]|uniref:GPP34 family phosphoprotein n=1 Tax=Streptomyces sulfonofaciens TaxID=68272 RepID=A0A919KVS6_9ACTN|nr:GPP34 family phosphoprotein [Streptomyces sulfonofaciens]GHH75145.1 hypothetical protein GCM10018793_17770 [Streptomyces sulfonofaciens]